MIPGAGEAFHESLIKLTGSSVTRVLRRVNENEIIELHWHNEKTKEPWEFSYPLDESDARALNSLSDIFEMEKLRIYFKILKVLKQWLKYKNYSKQETTMKNKPDDDEISINDGTASSDPEPATEDTADEIDINSGW